MTDHAARPHARFGASSAHRWFACPGSVALCAGLPDVPGPAALEGTRAHELLEALLRCTQGGNDGADVHEAEALWDVADQDMRDAVRVASDYVGDLLLDHPDAVLLVEHRFEVPVASAPGEVFGTNDACVFVASLRTLYVVDYKHGDGVYIPVEGNKQLLFYALGALVQFVKHNKPLDEYMVRAPEIDTVCMTIVQPRCPVGDPVREWWAPVEDVLAFGKEIGEAVERCKKAALLIHVSSAQQERIGIPVFVPGKEQCRFCPVRALCPAREAQALEAVGTDFGDVALVPSAPGALQRPAHVTGERLGQLLAARGAIEGWFAALEEEAERRLRAGEAVPGHKLVEAQARRQWNDETPEQMANLLSMIRFNDGGGNDNDFLVTKLRGLGEVEAILKQGCDRKEARRRLDAMAFLTTKRSSGALKVAPEQDPRPAVDAGAAFADVKQIEAK